jgi:hypothetical protein
MKPGIRRVVPCSSENSFLYHRVAGSDFGLQMLPTGALRPEQIQIIKAWIEQGAEQRADSSFVPKAGCFSSHNQSLAAMAVAPPTTPRLW